MENKPESRTAKRRAIKRPFFVLCHKADTVFNDMTSEQGICVEDVGGRHGGAGLRHD